MMRNKSAVRRFLKNDFTIGFYVAVAWQLLLTLFGAYVVLKANIAGDVLVEQLNVWDAGWYLHIFTFAYAPEGNPAAPAFYPLFPYAVALLSTVTFGLISPFILGLVLNTVATWLSITALIKILRHFKVTRAGRVLGIAAFLAFPSAFFLHVFYSEAVFIAIGFWAYYFALQRRWALMTVLLAVLTAGRLPSVLFVGLCGLEYLRSYGWKIRAALNPKILWFLLAPIGFLVYGLYLHVVRGDFLAMFHAYSATNDWPYQQFSANFIATLWEIGLSSARQLRHGDFTYELFINQLLPLSALALVFVAAVYCLIRLKREGIPLFIFGLVSIVLFTLNSNVISVHRYVLPCIVMYVAVALSVRRKWQIYLLLPLLLISLLLQFYLYSNFITDTFAG